MSGSRVHKDMRVSKENDGTKGHAMDKYTASRWKRMSLVSMYENDVCFAPGKK